MNTNYTIRQIQKNEEIEECTDVICKAFMTVAEEYNITRENCPSYASFRTPDQIRALMEDDFNMYSLFSQDKRVGFVCFKETDKGIYVLGLLSVLPEYRHFGYGRKLLDFVFDSVKVMHGEKVLIWIMNENDVLKKWYMSCGFVETGTRKDDNMPFTICDMEKSV